MENLIDQSPEKEMATPLPGLYRRSLPSPPAIEFCFLWRRFGTRRRRHRSWLISLHRQRWPARRHLRPRFAVYPFFPSLSLTWRTQICCLWVQIWAANMFLYSCVWDFHCNMSDCGVWIHCCLIVERFESDVWNSEILFFFKQIKIIYIIDL